MGLGAAGIAAAEVTLEGFPNHWTQDDPTQTSYRAYTPEHCPPGCVAIAGAAIVQYYKVGEGPDQATNTCRVNGESRTLTTESETYNWADPSSDDYGRLAYNLGVRLGMSYETSSSSVAFAKLKDVLDDYGLASTYVSCVSGEPTDDDYARLIQTPLCLGWPVALTIGGDLTSHAVIATGRREDGDTYIFAGYGGRGDGWNTLPDINLTANGGPGTYNRIDGLLIVRPPCEAGKIWAAVTGTVTAKSDLPNVTLTCDGQTATVTPATDGTYALALPVEPRATVTLKCGNRSTILAFTIPDDPTLAGSGSLNETLYAWFADESRETAVSRSSSVSIGFAQTSSVLGSDYANVPDSWLEAYFFEEIQKVLNSGVAFREAYRRVAEKDLDNDGLPNWQEYVAGTAPRNASSRFRITGLTITDGKPTLTWAPNLPNRDYRIQGKATLDGAWQDDPGEDARFFRVTVDNPAN